MNKHYLAELADELEAEHGSYPKSRDHFEQWLMLVMAMISAAGITDVVGQRRCLHDRYRTWLQELAEEGQWLNMTDVGNEIIDYPDREQPQDQEREALDEIEFEPPKAVINLRVPWEFEPLEKNEVQQLPEGEGDREPTRHPTN